MHTAWSEIGQFLAHSTMRGHLCALGKFSISVSFYCFQAKEEKQADDEEIKRLSAEVQRLKNALKEAQNRAKQVREKDSLLKYRD